MTPKVRIQVLLERRQYEQIKALASKRRQSVSSVVRALLDEALQGERAAAAAVRMARMRFIGSGRDAAEDVGREQDQYLYGGSQ